MLETNLTLPLFWSLIRSRVLPNCRSAVFKFHCYKEQENSTFVNREDRTHPPDTALESIAHCTRLYGYPSKHKGHIPSRLACHDYNHKGHTPSNLACHRCSRQTRAQQCVAIGDRGEAAQSTMDGRTRSRTQIRVSSLVR